MSWSPAAGSGPTPPTASTSSAAARPARTGWRRRTPATTSRCSACPPAPGTRALLLANDGDDEVRASRPGGDRGHGFRPEGLDEVRVAARLGDPGTAQRHPRRRHQGRRRRPPRRGHATRDRDAALVRGRRPLPRRPAAGAHRRDRRRSCRDGLATRRARRRRRRHAEVLARLDGGGKKVVTRSTSRRGGRPRCELPPRAVLVQVTPSGTAVRGAVVVADGGRGRAGAPRPGDDRAGARRPTGPAVADGSRRRQAGTAAPCAGQRPPDAGPSSGHCGAFGSHQRGRGCAGRGAARAAADDRHCRRPRSASTSSRWASSPRSTSGGRTGSVWSSTPSGTRRRSSRRLGSRRRSRSRR